MTFPPAEDPGPPYLLFDAYPFDRGPLPDFDGAMTTDVDGDGDADVVGGILKATDGVAYGYTSWFSMNFKRLTGLRGAYHYLQFFQDPVKQADFYANVVELAGGWDSRTIMPIVDVEFGGERAANRRANASQIIDCTSAFAARIKSITGRRCMLYGRGAMRDLGITSRMGCDCVWNPSYTPGMVMNGLTPAWSIDDVVLWQYSGDGTKAFAKLPAKLNGLGAIDISVFVDGNRKPTTQRLIERLI